jgi:hypothetical protein
MKGRRLFESILLLWIVVQRLIQRVIILSDTEWGGIGKQKIARMTVGVLFVVIVAVFGNIENGTVNVTVASRQTRGLLRVSFRVGCVSGGSEGCVSETDSTVRNTRLVHGKRQ